MKIIFSDIADGFWKQRFRELRLDFSGSLVFHESRESSMGMGCKA
jgi:hypothetical protein